MKQKLTALCKRGMPLLGLLLTGCAARPALDVADHVDLARYSGLWYEIARYPVVFQRGLVGVTAEYTLQDDGRVRVRNQGYKETLDGEVASIEGYATVADPATNAKLRIRFDPFPVRLFTGKYWILEVGTDYEYAVVSGPKGKVLWILSRTPTMAPDVLDRITARLADRGFDIDRLEPTLQPEGEPVNRKAGKANEPEEELNSMLLTDFTDEGQAWRTIDDVVMGGVSASQFRVADGVAHFEGTVSLENNGGFASARSNPGHFDLKGYDGLEIRCRGDGKKYAFRLRTTDAFDGISYQCMVETTENIWESARLPFAQFRPMFRGREVADAVPLDPSKIRTLGVLIADKQEGPFHIEFDWIRAYRDASEE